jgi:flagellin-like protein
MRKTLRIKEDNEGYTGIGVMVIFIAMVLVAAVASRINDRHS